MRIRVKYRRCRVTVDAEKPAECAACGRKGRIEMHHYFYAYPTSGARATPALALDNTVWLCYRCHRIADMLRNLVADIGRMDKVAGAIRRAVEEGEEVNHGHDGAGRG